MNTLKCALEETFKRNWDKHLLFQRILKRKKFRQTLTSVVKLLLVSESRMGLCLYNFTHSQPWSASQPYALPQGNGSNRRPGQTELTYKPITSYIALNPLSSHTCLNLPSGLEADWATRASHCTDVNRNQIVQLRLSNNKFVENILLVHYVSTWNK